MNSFKKILIEMDKNYKINIPIEDVSAYKMYPKYNQIYVGGKNNPVGYDEDLYDENRDYDIPPNEKVYVTEVFDDLDGIIHLAAVVGFPACHKYPDLANKVNLLSTKKIVDLKKKDTFFIYASTCSNYGIIDKDKTADESFELNPLSLYSKAKVDIEKYILNQNNTKKT